jgi:hypothetical protein
MRVKHIKKNEITCILEGCFIRKKGKLVSEVRKFRVENLMLIQGVV